VWSYIYILNFLEIVLLFGITHGQTFKANEKMVKINQKAVLIVVVLLFVIAGFAIASGCSALDPCVRQRNDCIEKCPTVIFAKEICQQGCNIQYDRCKGKY